MSLAQINFPKFYIKINRYLRAYEEKSLTEDLKLIQIDDITENSLNDENSFQIIKQE